MNETITRATEFMELMSKEFEWSPFRLRKRMKEILQDIKMTGFFLIFSIFSFYFIFYFYFIFSFSFSSLSHLFLFYFCPSFCPLFLFFFSSFHFVTFSLPFLLISPYLSPPPLSPLSLSLPPLSLSSKGTYTQTTEEVTHGMRVGWRNSAKCIGRIAWKNLIVRDKRHVLHPDAIFQEVFSFSFSFFCFHLLLSPSFFPGFHSLSPFSSTHIHLLSSLPLSDHRTLKHSNKRRINRGGDDCFSTSSDE